MTNFLQENKESKMESFKMVGIIGFAPTQFCSGLSMLSY